MTGEENRKCAMNPRSYCITGNIIGRQLQNGGNGLGCLPDVSYSLTCMDRHAVFCEKETYQKTVGTLTYSDYKGAGNQYINGDKCVVENKEQVRRLTPLECERLQGFRGHLTMRDTVPLEIAWRFPVWTLSCGGSLAFCRKTENWMKTEILKACEEKKICIFTLII